MRPAVAVCGFGRCGSTMVMSMLDAGGLPPALGSAEGSYEMDPDQLALLSQGHLSGHATKFLDLIHDRFPPHPDWRIIWLDRQPEQQARSVVKFLTWLYAELPDPPTFPPDAAEAFAESFRADRPKHLAYLRSVGEVLVLEFDRILINPNKAARQIARHIAPAATVFDAPAAGRAVLRRPAECAPDMAFEERVTRPRSAT